MAQELSTKINKDAGYMLLTRLMEYWSIKETCFEEIEEYYDRYKRDSMRQVYEAALLWNGGIDLAGRQKFCTHKDKDYNYKNVIHVHERFLKEHDRDDEYPDIEDFSHRVLEITQEIIMPMMDVTLKPAQAVAVRSTKTVVELTCNCPNCQRQYVIRDDDSCTFPDICYRCNTTLDVVRPNAN